MIKLSGYTEDEIIIEISGIRPGEKLFEELLNEDEIHPKQVYEKIYIGKSKTYEYKYLINILNGFTEEFNKEELIKYANK